MRREVFWRREKVLGERERLCVFICERDVRFLVDSEKGGELFG